jgi:Fe/S biogenesis protein NfuA
MSEVETVSIEISEVAQQHFKQLIDNEKVEGMGLRIFIDRIGTPAADIGITFCPPDQQNGEDMTLPFEGFVLYIDGKSAECLDEATIDYKTDSLGGELSITAPHLKGRKPKNDAPLYKRVEFTLNTDVNPQLASHGGVVSLVDITADNIAVLRFGGGCHGCGMVDVTLKHGIESRLLEQFPELTGVKDATDHSSGENPYYEPDAEKK